VPKDAPLPKLLNGLGISKSLQRIKFGGVVGKQSLLGIALVAMLGVVAWKVPSSQALFVAGIAAFIVALIAVLNFCYANKHPVEAMMEGAEVLALQHEVLASKSVEPPRDSRVIPNPEGVPPLLNPPEVAE
jgi:hypothetical protein